MESNINNIKWHDLTLMSVEIFGRNFQVKISSVSKLYLLTFSARGKMSIDYTEYWGRSIQIYELTHIDNNLKLTVQSGAEIIVVDCTLDNLQIFNL